MLRRSVSFDFKNLRRAGTLKKRFFTVMHVPTLVEIGSWDSTFEADKLICVPNSQSLVRVLISTCEIAEIEGSASPLNPIVVSAKRSSACCIFDVACRSKAILASVPDIPFPLSIT